MFLYSVSYFITYIKYDNKKYIESSGLLFENKRLKKELNEISKITLKAGILAKVIIRNLYNFYDELVINVGTTDGVINKSAVINEEGLIGIVTSIDKHRSNVKLLSANYNISVRIGDVYGNFNNGIVSMLDKYSDIKVGDIVYTSGLDEVPSDIYVGKVIEVNNDNEDLGKIAKVEIVNNRNLNYVYIVGKIK